MTRPDSTVAGRASVIVPTRNSARTLDACLRSIEAQSHRDVEIIVVDNHSTDATEAIASGLAHRFVRQGPERSTQRNVGWAMSTGEFVFFCDSDMVVDPEVVAQAVALLADSPDTGAIVIPELSRGDGFFARCRALEKELYLGDSSAEAARVFRREALEQVGGYNETLIACEDYDLADRVANSGWKVDRIKARIWHDEGRVRLKSTFAKKRYYGRSAERWVQQGSVRGRLRRTSLFRHPAVYLRKPVRASGLALIKAVDVAGLTVGLLEARHSRDQ